MVSESVYQIFPDRFHSRRLDGKKGIAHHRSKGRSVYLHDTGRTAALCSAAGETAYNPRDYWRYAERHRGVATICKPGRDGVVFESDLEAASQPPVQYLADYFRIDPVLGTEEDFRSLVPCGRRTRNAHFLTACFPITGSTASITGAYDVRAPTASDSPYCTWYTFEHYPDHTAVGGVYVAARNQQAGFSWRRYVITG